MLPTNTNIIESFSELSNLTPTELFKNFCYRIA